LCWKFVRSLPPADRKVIGEDLKAVELGFPLGPPLCKSLGEGLWEVRSSLPSRREARMIFFHAGPEQTLVVVHAFMKKTQKTPDAELRLAAARKREFER
jgi:phage-related protein